MSTFSRKSFSFSIALFLQKGGRLTALSWSSHYIIGPAGEAITSTFYTMLFGYAESNWNVKKLLRARWKYKDEYPLRQF